jgi:hypothetical protein
MRKVTKIQQIPILSHRRQDDREHIAKYNGDERDYNSKHRIKISASFKNKYLKHK